MYIKCARAYPCNSLLLHTASPTKMSKRPLPSSFEMECEDGGSRPCKIMSLDIIAEDDEKEEAVLDAIYRMTDDEGEGDCCAFVKSLRPHDRIPWIIFCQQLLRDKVHLQMNDESKNCFFTRYHSTRGVSVNNDHSPEAQLQMMSYSPEKAASRRGGFHPYLYMRDSQEYKDAYETLAYYCCKVRAYNSLLMLLLSFNIKFIHPNGKECIEQLEKEGECECLKLLGLIEENEDCWKWWGKNGFLSITTTTTTTSSTNYLADAVNSN